MSDHKKKPLKPEELFDWLFPLIMTVVFFPVGMVLVVLKLLDGKKKKENTGNAQRQKQEPMGARTTAAGQTAQTRPGAAPRWQKDPVKTLTRKGKRFVTFGTLTAAISAFLLAASIGSSFTNGEPQFFATMMGLLPFWFLLGVGLGCAWGGRNCQKKAQRFRSYLAMIGRNQSISITALASATGRSSRLVREDLEEMLQEGLFPTGFLDYGGDRLVLSGDGLREEPPKAARPQEPPKPTPEDMENAILAEIRAVNDAIANEKLSAQIDRIGVITAKILDYQRSHPERSPQLHSFLSYYLPTTLKILRAYSQLEAQEVAGPNITAAMERIEGMMDKVVEGFEKQLDQLFQGDAMDITADVAVLERMLAKDGLSGQGMTLEL